MIQVKPKSQARLAAIRLVAFDVDGVFTDGRFYLSDSGVESKAFCTLDGFGIRAIIRAGIQVAVISGRKSRAVEIRMQELGISNVALGCADKLREFDRICDSLGLDRSECAYVGDDIPDLPLLQQVGFSVAVANSVAEVRQACDYTTTAPGGYGAVREVCDMILDAAVER